MLRSLFMVLALVCVASAAQPSAEKDKTANLPGPFHPFNVTGKRAGQFHCLVSEHGLNPAVLIITRDLDVSDPLKDLIQKLDNVVAKNPNVQLGVFVVFVPGDEKFNVVTDDDKREKFQNTLADLAKQLMLKHAVLALTDKADLDKYKLADNEVYRVYVYHKYFVLAKESLEKDQLTAEKVDAILKAVAEQLKANRK